PFRREIEIDAAVQRGRRRNLVGGATGDRRRHRRIGRRLRALLRETGFEQEGIVAGDLGAARPGIEVDHVVTRGWTRARTTEGEGGAPPLRRRNEEAITRTRASRDGLCGDHRLLASIRLWTNLLRV